MISNMSDDKGTLHLVVEHLAAAVLPLKEAVTDIESFKEFMFELGWEVNSLPTSYSNLGSIVDEITTLVENLPENPDVLQIINALEKIRQLYKAIKGISDAPDGVDTSVFISEIAERLFDILLVQYLEAQFPTLYTALEMFGIIEYEYHEETLSRPRFVLTKVRWDKIQNIISDPISVPNIVYGWGTHNFDFIRFTQHLYELCLSLGLNPSIELVEMEIAHGYQKSDDGARKPIDTMVKIPLIYTNIDNSPAEVSICVIELPAEGTKLPGIILQPVIDSKIGPEYKISNNMTLRILPGSDLSSLFGFLLRPGEISFRNPFQPDSKLPDAGFGITLEYLNETPTVLFGSQEESRLEMKGLGISLKANYNQEQSELILVVEAALKELALVIASREQDSLLAKLLGGSDSRIPIPLIIGWSSKRGFYFAGSSGFGVSFNPHLKIGGAKIDQLTLQILSGDRVDPDPNFATEILLSISGSVGPISFSMDGIGLQLKTVFRDGNAGPFDIGIDLVPPHGVGLAINASGVKGGGFISRTENQYSGVIDLDLHGYSIQALVVVKTDPSISLLFAIFSQFRTPIQLGAGWKITRIGGLLGINHTVSHNSIASGIKSGILDNIMFPENIIRNAPTVIPNFETVFPVLHGQNIFGPAIQIAYGTPTLIAADVAVILEFPNPFLLSILGKVTSKLPNQDDPIIQINIGILGALDIVKGKAEAYGSLYDSKILGYPLSGDMAMAVSWGSEKNFIFSIGGFNPGFNLPSNFPPFNAPPLKRLNLAFSSSVTFECYLALTSNTLQIGARVDALFKVSGVEISGFLGFDALVQFNPLYYIIDVAAGFSVKFRGRSLASIAFLGFIEGPNPHRIKGSVTFSILWWDISRDVDKTFGDKKPEIIVSIDPWPILEEALEQNDSWTAELPSWEVTGVVIKEFLVKDQEADQLIHPLGNFFKVSQRVVPLNHTLTKFGSSNPINNFKFEIISLNGTNSLDSTQDYFAPAQFTEIPESEKLNLNSYELMDSGVIYADKKEEIDFSFESASFRKIEYKTILLENMANKEDIRSTKIEKLHPLNKTLSQTFILAGIPYHAAVSNSNKLKYQLKDHARKSALHNEKFVIIDEDKNTVVESIFKGELIRSVAINKLADYRKANPKDKRNLNVISSFELPEVPLPRA